MYHIISFEVLDNAYIAKSVEINYDLENNLHEGIPHNLNNLKIILPPTRGIITDYIYNSIGLLIVANTIKDMFVKYGKENIEYYEVNLRRKTLKRFYYLNIINFVDAINFENSILEEYIPGLPIYKKIEKLTLFEDSVEGLHFFTLKELSSYIIVSNELKEEFEKLNSEVLKFTPIEEFTIDMSKT